MLLSIIEDKLRIVAEPSARALMRHNTSFSVVVFDYRGKQPPPIQAVDSFVLLRPQPAVIVIVPVDAFRLTVDLVSRGVHECIAAPVTSDTLAEALNNVLRRGPDTWAGDADGAAIDDFITGESTEIKRLRAKVRRVAASNCPVLVTGESGVGKQLVVDAIHRLSPRSDGPSVAFNACALPETLFESELFGVAQGAFTGAHERPGLFEHADGGTLFIDEIGELPLSLQPKLLRAIETQRIRAVGSTTSRQVDVRIVTATNRPLDPQRIDRMFRPDLYYRIATVHLNVPPLRERVGDIPILARALMNRSDMEHVTLTNDAMVQLQSYSWPGNVRELRSVLYRSYLMSGSARLRSKDLLFSTS